MAAKERPMGQFAPFEDDWAIELISTRKTMLSCCKLLFVWFREITIRKRVVLPQRQDKEMTKGFSRRLARGVGMVAMGCVVSANAWAQANKKPETEKLRVYMVDVEGGQATLFVTPAGQSLLIDTGWPGYEYRDADRIVAAAKLAGLKKIDYVLI